MWLWLLSGAPVALVLTWATPFQRVALFTLFLVLDTAHTLSPIALAWGHAGFRRVMLARPGKYIVWPGVVFAIGSTVAIITAIGWTTYVPGTGQFARATGWDNPYPILFGLYFAWNFYHFAMQNHGVARLCGLDLGRWSRPLALIGTALAIKVAPFATSVNHWIVDIGLSWRAMGYRWVFLVGIALVGAAIPWLWSPLPVPQGPVMRRMEGFVLAVYGIRLFGLGFVHFLYSKWCWQFSNPLVRETIGRSLANGYSNTGRPIAAIR